MSRQTSLPPARTFRTARNLAPRSNENSDEDSSTRSPRLASNSPPWLMSDDPSAPPTPALLLRHGQTELSVQKRFSGTGDQPLTEHGRLQAAAQHGR